MLKKTAIAAITGSLVAFLVTPTSVMAEGKNVTSDKPVPITVPTTKTIKPKKPEF